MKPPNTVFKLGVIRRVTLEEHHAVDVTSEDINAAARALSKVVSSGCFLVDVTNARDQEVVGTELSIGTWDEAGEWTVLLRREGDV